MTTIRLTATQFRALTDPVVPFADTHRAPLPILNAVHLCGHGESLTARATDRRHAAIQRIHVPAPDGWSATLPLAVVKAIRAEHRPSRRHDPELTFAFGDTLTVTDEAGRASVYELVQERYPGFGSRLADAFVGEPVPSGVALNPHLLAHFADGRTRSVDTAMRIYSTGDPMDPVGFAIGSDFRGVVMPFRNYGDVTSPLDNGWEEILRA